MEYQALVLHLPRPRLVRVIYLSYILGLKEETVQQIIGIFHDYSKEAKVG